MMWIPILITAIDQITKRLAMYYFERNIALSFWKFFLVLSYNKGISFSWLNSMKGGVFFKYLIAFILVLIGYLAYQSKEKLEKIALNLILGGGLSNLLDRFLFNGVIDFICFDPKIISPIIFNVADIAISLGGILFLLSTLINKEKTPSFKGKGKNDQEIK